MQLRGTLHSECKVDLEDLSVLGSETRGIFLRWVSIFKRLAESEKVYFRVSIFIWGSWISPFVKIKISPYARWLARCQGRLTV